MCNATPTPKTPTTLTQDHTLEEWAKAAAPLAQTAGSEPFELEMPESATLAEAAHALVLELDALDRAAR